MSSWRITTKFVNLDSSVNTSPVYLGATAIKAPKGPNTWYYFEIGQAQKIIDTFGYPSASYPGIQDAIDANVTAGMWISSAIKSTNALYGGVVVTSMGSVPLVEGVTTQAVADYTAIPGTASLGVGAGVQTIFSGTIPNFAYYNPSSLILSVNGSPLALTITSSDTETFTFTGGTGTLVKSTGLVTLTFSSAPTGAVVVSYTFNLSRPNAIAEVINLAISGTVSGAGSVNITLRGATPVNVVLTDTEAATAVATAIRAATFTGWITGGSGANVTFTKTTGGAQVGVNTFSLVTSTGLTAVFTVPTPGESVITPYFTLFDKFQQADDISVQVTANANIPGNFFIQVFRYNPIQKASFEISGSPIEVSISPIGTDANGVGVYITNVFDDNQVLFKSVVQTSIYTTFVSDTTQINLTGGARGDATSGTDLVPIYELLRATANYPVSVVFDGLADPLIAAEFAVLRAAELKRVRFALCTVDQDPATTITTPLVANNGINDRGIYYYTTNWGIHKNLYTGISFNCSNMGLIAGKLLAMLINGPGGQPAWLDEAGVGGQLGSMITKLNRSVTETQLKQLDGIRFNAVTQHPTGGFMIENARTSQTADNVYSYISQSSLADLIVQQIENNVLPFMIYKLNDDFHQAQVRSKCNAILQSVNPWLSAFTVVCDRSNNGPDVLNAQKMNLGVVVIFQSYATKIQLTFVSSPAGTDVTQVFAQ